MIEEVSTLLLVDDNPDNLFILQQVINQHLPQCEVATALSARKGLEIAAARPLDGALIDVQMPEMDGLEMCRHLKADDSGTDRVPVILITAHRSSSEEKAEGLEAGAVDFIARPIDNVELVARIKTILRMKRAERALQKSEQMHRAILGTVPDMMFRIRKDGVFLSFLAGKDYKPALAPSEFLNKKVQEVLPEEIGSQTTHLVKKALETGQMQLMEYQLPVRLPNGPLCDFESRMVVSGENEVLAIVRDITERKQSEKALLESEEKYKKLSQQFQTLLDGIPDALCLLSPELEVVWTNKGAFQYVNGKIDKLAGQKCYKLWQNRSVPCEECPAIRSFQTGKNEEAIVTTPDKKVCGIKVFPQKNEEGKVINAIVLASDITEKVKMREEAAQANRLASLGELAAGVAHEINNPNALILLNTPVLKEAWADATSILDVHCRENGDFMLGRLKYSRMREVLPSLHSEILDGANRIKRIVEDLKDFVRQEGSGHAEVIDLNEVVQTSVRLVANAIKKSTNNFVSVYGEKLPGITGDFRRIEQVVINLILNACQALSEKDKGIFISTCFDEARGINILEVRDEGVGIAPGNLPYIRDPFFTTRREVGGTGLGLSVSTRIVHEHGGRLDFSSTPGKGTTVTLALPVCQEVDTQ
jgi:PAS domain S-box-containing protein